MSYSTDKAWEQQTAPMMIDALLQVYHGKIEPASATDDAFHGTDFIWTKPDDKIIRLAMRVRESSFYATKMISPFGKIDQKQGIKPNSKKSETKIGRMCTPMGFRMVNGFYTGPCSVCPDSIPMPLSSTCPCMDPMITTTR